MSTLGVTLVCGAGGHSIIKLCFNAIRSGSDNDKASMRCVRRPTGGGTDVVLPGVADFTLRQPLDMFSWFWMDTNIPADGSYDYVIQIRRNSGAGTFYEMNVHGQHFKK